MNKIVPEISVSNQYDYQEIQSSIRDQMDVIPTRKLKTSLYQEDNIAQVSNIDMKMRDNGQIPPESQSLRARQRVPVKVSKESEHDQKLLEPARMNDNQKKQLFGEHEEEEHVLNKMNKYSRNSNSRNSKNPKTSNSNSSDDGKIKKNY